MLLDNKYQSRLFLQGLQEPLLIYILECGTINFLHQPTSDSFF